MLINSENLEMTGRHTLSFLALICLSVPLVLSRQPHFPDLCDGGIQWDPRGLQTNQMTVLINGYSESRIPLLHTITAAYSSSALVSSVLVLWGNRSTPMQTLTQLSHNLSFSSPGSAPISVLRQSSASLNSRFLPRKEINTRAVLICDDDVLIDLKSLEFAFRIWTSNQDRMIGFFSRSHDFDLATKDWIYTVHPDRYSILLTKAMIIKSEYLFQYSCGDRDTMIDMKNVVDQMQNCEDVLMNFVVADAVNAGPILVGAERARDWGDSRNEVLQKGHEMVAEKEAVKEVGLSSRRGDHRKRRGECITKFHRILGRMPLRYSYGKVVDSVGEQGLCEKGGKLVFCDKQVHR